MASNENNGNPDRISRESGGPAHNTTLDVLDGRLPGPDQTSNMGQRLHMGISFSANAPDATLLKWASDSDWAIRRLYSAVF